MSHTCKNLLIRCMDFRLNNEVVKWTKESGIFEDGFDIISVAGASKVLAGENSDVIENFLGNVDVSVNLHHAEKVVIFHHSDCGAYAKDYKFNSVAEEKEKQIEDMKKSKMIILEKYLKVEVVLVWGEMEDSEGKKVKFEIV